MSLPPRDPASPSRLIHGHFFFVDIVGLSDPKMSTKTQIKKIEILNKCVSETQVYKSTPKESMIILHTGDGMCIGFLQGPELPLHIAAELQQKLTEYNTGIIPSETVRVRMGLHTGTCYYVKDIMGRDNIWGPGMILARRVMDFGDDGHILLSPSLAEDLRELSDEYHSIIKKVHDFVLKHGRTMLIYSAYGDDFGNPENPTKGAVMRSKYGEDVINLQKTTLYPSIVVDLTIKDPATMLVEHKRTYEVVNTSKEPIKNVLHGIATDVEKATIDDLKVRVYDENHRNLRISSINVNKPDCKEFTTEFMEPIVKGDTGRKYTLVYEVEEPERYFENAFLIDCQKLTLGFTYPQNHDVKRPILYEINQETEVKSKSNIEPTIDSNDKFEILKWRMTDIPKGETLRIEW